MKQYRVVRKTDHIEHASTAGHKYVKREKINGKWLYYYEDDIGEKKGGFGTKEKKALEKAENNYLKAHGYDPSTVNKQNKERVFEQADRKRKEFREYNSPSYTNENVHNEDEGENVLRNMAIADEMSLAAAKYHYAKYQYDTSFLGRSKKNVEKGAKWLKRFFSN